MLFTHISDNYVKKPGSHAPGFDQYLKSAGKLTNFLLGQKKVLPMVSKIILTLLGTLHDLFDQKQGISTPERSLEFCFSLIRGALK